MIDEQLPYDSLVTEPVPVAARDHAMAKKILGGVLLAGTVGSLLFEQSPLNESLRVNQAVEVIEEGGDPFDVGLRVGAITMAIELGSSALIVAGLNQQGGLINSKIQVSKQRKSRREAARKERKLAKKQDIQQSVIIDTVPDENIHDLSPMQPEHDAPSVNPHGFKRVLKSAGTPVKYAGVALGVGAGIVVVDKHMEAEHNTARKDVTHAIGASALVAGVSGAIGYLGAGGVKQLEDTPLERSAEIFVDYATDLRVWAIILSPIMAKRFVRWTADVARERKQARNTVPVEV